MPLRNGSRVENKVFLRYLKPMRQRKLKLPVPKTDEARKVEEAAAAEAEDSRMRRSPLTPRKLRRTTTRVCRLELSSAYMRTRRV